METLGFLLVLASFACIPAILVVWWKKIPIKKKIFFAGIASFVLGMVFIGIGQPSAEEIEARAKENREKFIAELQGEEKNFYDTKLAQYISEGKNEEDAKKSAVDDIKNKRDEEKKAAEAKAAEEKAAKEAEEKRLAEEKAAQEKLAAEKKAAQEKIAAEKKAQEEKLAAQQKAEQERIAAEQKKIEAEQKKFAEVREELEKWEREGKLQYQHLRDGSVNVILTERANFNVDRLQGSKSLDDIISKTADYALQDEHERNIVATSIQCMKLVQRVKEAGLNVNNFEIHLRGDVVDGAGYKSVDDVVICEISGSKNFKKDDPYSFYNATDRYWTINGL